LTIKKKLKLIDIKNILDTLCIDYKEKGKNVGANDINIDCPFCGADKHLGISLGSGLVNCWVCNFIGEERYPSLIKVLMKSSDIKYDEIKEVMEDNGWENNYIPSSQNGISLAKKCLLPKEAYSFSENTPDSKSALKYLRGRGFDFDTINKYGLKIASVGPYSGRIIIPIYLDGELCCYTGRRFKGDGGNRYKHAHLSYSLKRVKDLLYNFDSARKFKKAYLLEGPTDVWNMGNDSMCVFKSSLSKKQRNLILKSKFSVIIIVYDYLAASRAYEAAEELSLFVPKIKVVRLPDKKRCSR